MELAVRIREAALQCGFSACGIVKMDDMRGYADAIAGRIAHFPESRPMYAKFIDFATPELSVPWAKSIIVCAQWLGEYRIPQNLKGLIGKSYCIDPRKNPNCKEFQGRELFAGMLENMGLRYATKSDFGITAVRWAAAKAGVGIIRKNNFLYMENGSWCHLDAFLIDRELELKSAPTIKDCPKKCNLCMKACPTGALKMPFQTNGVACVSFLTTFAICAPDKPYYNQCGTWIFGCDACQDVCPFNAKAWSEGEEFPGLKELAEKISYEQILSLDEPELSCLLAEKFWYIKPDTIWKWKCNVLNAINNNFEERYLPHIEPAMHDTRREVSEMARWVYESVCSPKRAVHTI
jgi:epoxyqueuosine reductase